MQVRVQKIIAESGYCSRRKAEELIEKGLVYVNGQMAKIGQNADPEDEIVVNGQRIHAEKKAYLMLHKPRGYITTASDPWGRKSVLELVHVPQRVFPVGRLDKDTTGLLLLTNDGAFANQIMHPRYEVRKSYEATLDRKIEDDDLRKLNEGIVLDGRKIEARAQRLSAKRVKITIHTGLNKEVKRLFKKLGYWVKDLTRTEIGNLKLNVREGKWRKLSISEVKALTGAR